MKLAKLKFIGGVALSTGSLDNLVDKWHDNMTEAEILQYLRGAAYNIRTTTSE